jgi:hypothetical protein
MLPAFNDDGNLPPGIHPCLFEVLATRFGTGSEERETQIDELRQFVEAAWRMGVRRILVNGSFVTGKLSPNDVDVVFLPGEEYPGDELALNDPKRNWPFLQLIEAITDVEFEEWGFKAFGIDRRRNPKGVVEVIR